MSARSVVLLLAGVDLFSYALAVARVGGNIPPRSYLLLDVLTELILLIGLWFLWRIAWWLAMLTALLGEVFEVARSVEGLTTQRLVLSAIGLLYIGLLMAPPLRAALRPIRSAQPG